MWPIAAVLTAVGVSWSLLYEHWTDLLFSTNDLGFHRVVVDYARRAPAVLADYFDGRGPADNQYNASLFGTRSIPPFFSVDHFFPSIGGGVPLFHHYQHLPHVLAGLLARLVSPVWQLPYAAETDGLALMTLCTMPVIIFKSLRELRFSRQAAAISSVLYIVVNDKAPPQDLGWASYGIGWMSYLHSPGHGLWSQLFAVAAFFPCLSTLWAAIRSARCSVLLTLRCSILLASVILSNLFYGYMAAASAAGLVLLPALHNFEDFASIGARFREIRRRALRFCTIVFGAGALAAYFIAPFMIDRDFINDEERRRWKFDSMGPEFVLPHLIAGDLLDYQAHDGRSVDRGWFCAPVITLFAFGGLGLVILRQLMSVCPSCCEGTCFGVTDVPSKARAERDLWVGACFVVWTMLFCGRGLLGAWTDFLPFAASLHMHRFIGGFQVFALLLCGCVVDSPLSAAATQLLLSTRSTVAGNNGHRSKVEHRWSMRKVFSSLFLTAVVVWFGGSVLQALDQRRMLLSSGRERQMNWNEMWKPSQVAQLRSSGPTWQPSLSQKPARGSFEKMVDFLQLQRPGRIFAGFLEHQWYRWINAVLQETGFDMVGPLYHTMAVPGQFMSRHFDYQSRRMCQLFNVRYAVLPPSVPVPSFYTPLWPSTNQSEFRLYSVGSADGYFGVGQVVTVAHSTDLDSSSTQYERWKAKTLPQILHSLPQSVLPNTRPKSALSLALPRPALLSNTCQPVDTVGHNAYSDPRVKAPMQWDDIVIASEGWFMGKALASDLYLAYPPFTSDATCLATHPHKAAPVDTSLEVSSLKECSVLVDDHELDFECHPAKFSAGFDSQGKSKRVAGNFVVSGKLRVAHPFDGCGTVVSNATNLKGTVLVMKRGGCTFGAKAAAVVASGDAAPAAVLVIDTPAAPSTNNAGGFTRMAGFDEQLAFPFVLVPHEGLRQLLKTNDHVAQPAAAAACFTAGGTQCNVVEGVVKVAMPATQAVTHKDAPKSTRSIDFSKAKYNVRDELVLPNYYGAVVDLLEWRNLMDDTDPTVHAIVRVGFHPRWVCRVNGQERPCLRVVPSFVAVPLTSADLRGANASALVECGYDVPIWKRALIYTSIAVACLWIVWELVACLCSMR